MKSDIGSRLKISLHGIIVFALRPFTHKRTFPDLRTTISDRCSFDSDRNTSTSIDARLCSVLYLQMSEGSNWNSVYESIPTYKGRTMEETIQKVINY